MFVYAVFTDFLYRHKSPQRFLVAPKLSLARKPKDEVDGRKVIVDIGVVNTTRPGSDPPVKLRLGVEIKRALDVMETLPPPACIISNPDVESAFHALSLRAQDQAKTAIRNKYTFSDTVDWIVLIGPYWTDFRFGPFTEAQLAAQAPNPSPSAGSGPVPHLPDLFLLCEDDSYRRLEAILASTDGEAQHLVDAMGSGL